MEEQARDPIDAPLRQLVAFWRDRAERLRGQSPESPRAEVFDMCAAQLAEAISALRFEAPAEAHAEALSLFRDATER